MRVKIECGPPLPSLKVWFVVPAVSTVDELKAALCAELPALRTLAPRELTLLLDGFELTGASAIDVVRDGELLTVRQVPGVVSHKRKSVEEGASPKRKRVKRAAEPAAAPPAPATQKAAAPAPKKIPEAVTVPPVASKPAPQESSSEDDSSSDSDDETSSEEPSSEEESSSEESDSSEDSSSDESSSDSSSSSAPSVQTSKRPAQQPAKSVSAQNAASKSTPTHHVPPGHGKSTTQNRNLRRRRKKMYERLASHTEPASANEVPLGERQPAARTPPPQSSAPTLPAPPAAPTIMMASLSNKNKRKGFKQAMAAPLPKKIVFDAPPPAEAPLPFASAPAAEIVAAAPGAFPRLVPPSERQESGTLPPNMFVTSVDVEEGMHPVKKKNKKKTKGAAAEAQVVNEAVEVENMVLDYGEPDEQHISTQRDSAPSGGEHVGGDWSYVERNWASLAKVTQDTKLDTGALVGWKELAINPATFTPEFMLAVGRVVRGDDTLVVQPVHKPTEVSFGGYEEEEPSDAPQEEETFDWATVYAGDWRIV